MIKMLYKMLYKLIQLSILSFAIILLSFVTPAGALKFELVLASEASFNLPHDLALSPDGRYLYVADNGNDRIAVLDPQSLVLMGTIGATELSEPHDAAFDPQGRLMVADTGNDRVVVYHINGTRGEKVTVIRGGFKRPEGIAAYPGKRVYVTGAHSNNLVAFDNGIKVSATAGLSGPHDVETDGAGNILVVDSNNDRLLFLKPDLQIIKTLTGALTTSMVRAMPFTTMPDAFMSRINMQIWSRSSDRTINCWRH
jgi:YVTN family beta-propeller protein